MKNTRFLALPAAVAVAVAAAVLPGCGGGDVNAFRDDYNAAMSPFIAQIGDLGHTATTPTGASPEAMADELDALARSGEQARRKIGELDPPDDTRDELERVSDQLAKSTDAIRAVAETTRAGDQAREGEAGRQLLGASADLHDAEAALKRAVDG